eukprot:GFUD01027567.1.p1 GENE.GFUD01027567.1~~GFUD01027567.1.p1  ORF type:complete len:696 (+),score=127.09 GFUD01027567.1:159-2090(+)
MVTRFSVIFLLTILTSCQSLVQPTKCCPQSQALDTSDPTYPQCVTSVSPGLDLSVDTTRPARLPNCKAEYEVHSLGSGDTQQSPSYSWVGKNGALVTTKYGEGFEISNFCVDIDIKSGGTVAVTCDACKEKIQCVNLCCPHGYAFIRNPDYEDYDYDKPFMICSPVKGVAYEPKFWKGGAIATFHRNKDYLLIGPEVHTEPSINPQLFECPSHGNFIGATFVPDDLGDFRLLTTGRLEGANLPVLQHAPAGRMSKTKPNRKTAWTWVVQTVRRFARQINFEPVTETITWTRAEFCMIHADPPEYDDTEPTYQMKLTFMTCLAEETSWGDQFNKVFTPLSKIIPIVCLLFTVIVYMVEPSLRNCLIGKITIALILNNIISFIIATHNYLMENDSTLDRRESPACVFSGYIAQYAFLAFFFWMNVMAIDIWIKFRDMSPYIDKDLDRKKFIRYTLYAQGMPLLICSLTAIVDAFSSANYQQNLHYPEMGVYSCFLGSQRTGGRVTYFERPEFIYFGSFIIVILTGNAIFLSLTINKFVENWKNQEELRKIQERDSAGTTWFDRFQRLKEQMRIVLRLQGLFAILSIPWLFEIIYYGMANDFQVSFTVNLMTDVWNLISGVLVFLFLVVRKRILNNLKKIVLKRKH